MENNDGRQAPLTITNKTFTIHQKKAWGDLVEAREQLDRLLTHALSELHPLELAPDVIDSLRVAIEAAKDVERKFIGC